MLPEKPKYEIQLKLNEAGRGAFIIEEKDGRLAEMVLGIIKEDMVIYHTKVSDQLAGQGIGSQLLTTAVTYAREHHLKIIPLCPFVHAQFKKYPDQYKDVWNKTYRA